MAEVAGLTSPYDTDDVQLGDTCSGTEPILTEAAAQSLRQMEKHGVVQPPRVYAEGPSISAFN